MSVMLERTRELDELNARIGSAAAGDGGLVVVEGQAGIGKSRLLGQARKQAEGSMRVLAARGGEMETEFAFGVVRQLLESELRSSVLDGELLSGAAAPASAVLEAPGHDISWTNPDPELHSYMNKLEDSASLSLYGRRLYELMESYWPTADQGDDVPAEVAEYARTWRESPKVVFSNTLESVTGNARLVNGDAAEEVARIKRETDGTIAVGGAHLAASLLRAGLLDEVEAIIYPIVLGAGTPLLPELTDWVKLRYVATKTFGSGAVSIRYRVGE